MAMENQSGILKWSERTTMVRFVCKDWLGGSKHLKPDS